jgi:uncharacterized protein YjiS (DUF1127 family)
MLEIARNERSSDRSSASARQASLFESLAVALLRHLWIWRQRIRQRQSLATADDWLLKDIGVSRADVMHECDKAFWRE